MLEDLIKGIKTMFPELVQQRKIAIETVNNCMNKSLVQPTIKLEHLDLSAQCPNIYESFRQKFTENGIQYSWWGIKLKNGLILFGLERITYNTNKGTYLENLWLSIAPSTGEENVNINLIRSIIHSDLF